MYKKYLKSFLDTFFALIVLILISPLFLALCFAIKIDSKGPIFFKQCRIGKYKKEFYIYKFRSMRIDAPKNQPTHLLKNPDTYITKLGKFLRKSSLDELPQLINILIGQMSFVGPRPALYNQYDLIALRDKFKANDVRPGLTGWAQVNGRDELPIEVKAEYDGEYVLKLSFAFDCLCFLRTFKSVTTAEGVKEGRKEE